jgi:putative endonuclease
VDINNYSKKDIGSLGEKIAAEYLRRKGYELLERNWERKTGEIDIIMRKDSVLHFVEVKSVLWDEFPEREGRGNESYDPSANLHEYKIRKVARTSQWYMAERGWEGESQIDGALVWIRKRDGFGRVQYLPQIL